LLGVALAEVGTLTQQQPDHHALHVFEFDRERIANAHRPLHPMCAQVQVAHAVGLGNRGLRQDGCGWVTAHGEDWFAAA
jgi:hypothetical protein